MMCAKIEIPSLCKLIMGEKSPKRVDFRLTLLENSEELENLLKIKEIIHVNDYKTIVKSCISVAYHHFYKKLENKDEK